MTQQEPRIFTPTPFTPRPWLTNGHLQTILGNFLPRGIHSSHLPPATAELVEVSPAAPGHIASQVLCHCHWQPEAVRSERLTVVLVHGLEGSSKSQYILGNANKLWRAGCNIVRMNMRNCGGTEALSATLYHSGLSQDVLAVITTLGLRYSLPRFAAVGYSMGGNLVLKLAGELGANTLTLTPAITLTAAVGVSPAIDLAQSADALHLPVNRIYERRFLAALLRRYRRKARLFPWVYDPRRAEFVTSLRQFDERITALYNGFAGASDYYFRAAAARVLPTIAIPTLILHALDDPFVRLTPESRTAILANPHVTLIEPTHGGHCAFLATPHPKLHDDGYWAETTLLNFLLSL